MDIESHETDGLYLKKRTPRGKPGLSIQLSYRGREEDKSHDLCDVFHGSRAAGF